MNDPFNRRSQPAHDDTGQIDEGGLRAPPGLTGWRKAWWWFDFIILVKLARLRFIAVLAAIGVVITQWDTLAAYYDKWTRPASATQSSGGDFEWFCPMHPAVVRDNAKDKCPVCFMPLSKRKKGETHEESLPAGIVNRVQLSPYRVVLAGVQTWPVDYVPLVKQIVAVGYVEFDERGLRNVSARVKGRIDTLYVNETGKMVDEGDVLASLYSPELNVTVRNLVDAQRIGNLELVRSARGRLELLGISGDQIDDVLKSSNANTHLKIRSPISGHVIKKYIVEGQYVDEGTPLYDVADLSTVWIQAQVYEDDLAFLPVDQDHKPIAGDDDEGRTVTATTQAYSNEPFHGKLAFVYPHVDEQTRSVTIRCEVANPHHKLRPGTTANVTLEIAPRALPMLADAVADDSDKTERLAEGLVLAVPESAVIDTGSQQIVYRQSKPGVFEGVKVELGPRMTGPEGVTCYPVMRGLTAGDAVVTAGSFLVDAETRLNPAAGSIYFGGSGGSKGGGSSVTTVRPSTPEDADAQLDSALAALTSADRQLAESQEFCPVLSDNRLGSMGTPIRLKIEGKTVFVCCDGCKKEALAEPKETLAKVEELKKRKSGDKGGKPARGDAAEKKKKDPEAKIRAALAKLSEDDRALALAQRTCPVIEGSRLGGMGTPVKLAIEGQPVFICCEGCKEDAEADVKATLAKAKQLKKAASALAKLPAADRALAETQRFCPVMEDSRLGLMGVPVKLTIEGKSVFICCEGCKEGAESDPDATLAKVKELTASNRGEHGK